MLLFPPSPTYKSTTIKRWLKKPQCDPPVLASGRPVSTLPFPSKTLLPTLILSLSALKGDQCKEYLLTGTFISMGTLKRQSFIPSYSEVNKSIILSDWFFPDELRGIILHILGQYWIYEPNVEHLSFILEMQNKPCPTTPTPPSYLKVPLQ